MMERRKEKGDKEGREGRTIERRKKLPKEGKKRS